jgi:4-hydroxybenzoate polyprenyltransferase
MNTRQFRYKELFFLTYLVFAISFFIPAYAGESMSFCCGGIEIWPGWKCALAVFAVIFNEKFHDLFDLCS